MRSRRLSPLAAGALIAAAAMCGPVAVTVAAEASASADAPQPGDTRGLQPTRVAEAETAPRRSSGNDRVSETTRAAGADGEGAKTAEVPDLQSYLQWRAQRLPGRSCDPNGPVYVVLEPGSQLMRDVPSDRTELLIHFTHSGAPDEIRIERSTGDEDLDARVAQAVCSRLRARNIDETLPSDTGWAHLTVRVSERRSRDE